MITLFFRYDNAGNKMKLVNVKATPRSRISSLIELISINGKGHS